MSRRIRLHIDRVVLTGVGRVDPAALERALKVEIAKTLSQANRTGALDRLSSAQQLPGGRLTKHSDPTTLGRHIASRIVGDVS